MARLKKGLWKAVCMLAVLVVVAAFCSQTAFANKNRLSVGFNVEEALNSTQLNETWINSEMGSIFWPLVYDQFWIMGPPPNYDPLPCIVKKWETNDNQTWRFYLEENARFHDGKPVTAEDVAFTLWYVPKSNPVWDYNDNDIEKKASIKIIDKHTIEFTLAKKLNGKYPPLSWMPVLPKHVWEPHKRKLGKFKNKKCIGSGRFKLKKFKSGEYIHLIKNKDYWGEKAGVDEVVFKTFGGADALNMALKRGQIEFVGYHGVSPLNLNSFKNTENVDVAISPGISIVWLTFNLHKQNAIQDKVVRQAIMHAIDRGRLIQMAYLGHAQPAYSFVYSELPDHNPNLPKYEFDPDKSRAMLDNAGYTDKDGDGFRDDPIAGGNMSFDFLVPSAWTTEVKIARIAKEQLKEIGIEIKIKVLELDTYYEFIYTPTSDEFDIAAAGEEPGPNGDWIWEFARGYNHGGAGWNQAFYDNPEFDATLEAMHAAEDLEKRKALVYKLQEIISEDLPYAPLLRWDAINPYRTDIFEGHVLTMGGISNWINPWSYFKLRPKQ